MHPDGGVGVDAGHLHTKKVSRHRHEVWVGLGEAVLLVMEGVDELIDPVFRDVEPRIEAEQNWHALKYAVADVLGEYRFRIDLNDGEPRRLDLYNLVRTRIDDPDVNAALGVLPVGWQRATSCGVDR